MSLNSKTRRRNRPLDSAVSGTASVDAVQADRSEADIAEADIAEADIAEVDIAEVDISPTNIIDTSENIYESAHVVSPPSKAEDRRRLWWTTPHVSTLQPTLNADTDRRSRVSICFTLSLEGLILAVNRLGAERLGYTVGQLVGSPLIEVLHPGDRYTIQNYFVQLAALAAQMPDCPAAPEFRYLCQTGEVLEGEATAQLLYGEAASPTLVLIGTPSSSAERERQPSEPLAEEQSRRLMVQVTAELTHQLQRSPDSNQLLAMAVTQIRQQLQADRVLIYRTYGNSTGTVLAEAILDERVSALGRSLSDNIFLKEDYQAYALGRVEAIADINQILLPGEVRTSLQQFGVRAMVVVPIVRQETLWGLFVVHQHEPRQWQPWEIDLTSHLANQLATLVYQSELCGYVQHLNVDLSRQIQRQTAQLELAFEFEATLKRITDKVRDSLDEDQILQVAVQELATCMGISSCNAALYDLDAGTTTVRYEYTTFLSPYQGRTAKLADFAEIYDQLLQGQWLQFCSMTPNPVRGYVSTLVTPIVDDQDVLGDLWLVNHKYHAFSEQDIRMAQQVANQCAIAIRQARLYQASRSQIKELERLNQLKDDFLSTVSHELRTPMSNIKMAIQMLEIFLAQSGALEPEMSRVPRYFKILRDESQREINLINDLLDLSRLNAGTEELTVSAIDLKGWLGSVSHPFEERARNHQQRLELSIPPNLPELITDSSKLQRIITELLTNACKYTPAGELIHLAVEVRSEVENSGIQASSKSSGKRSKKIVQRQPDVSGLLLSAPFSPHFVQIHIINTGVTISPSEGDRIFEKFYRIPNHDPWQYGGIGLGLALVKKIVAQIQGRIYLENQVGQTCFTLELPLQPRME